MAVSRRSATLCVPHLGNHSQDPSSELIVKLHGHRSIGVVDHALADAAFEFVFDEQAIHGNLGQMTFIWPPCPWASAFFDVDRGQAAVRADDSIRPAMP